MAKEVPYTRAEVSGPFAAWPDRALIMPDSDEYVVVRTDRIDQLAEYRISWAFEGFLSCVGIAAGSLVGAVVGIAGWPLNVAGFISTIIFIGGAVGLAIFGCIWWSRKSKFTKLHQEILAGPRFVVSGQTK